MNTNTNTNKWFFPNVPKTQSKLRLFCFPYAGGGASIYRQWLTASSSEIEICPIQLPGRETRLIETPFENLNTLISQIAQILKPYLHQPFALFGHSMGALISFELSHYLNEHFEIQPRHIFVSAHRAPHLPRRTKRIHDLPQAEFLVELERMQGTPPEILRNEELLELVLPALRSDFAICENYRHTSQGPLSCPISAFGGTEDDEVSENEIAAWREHSQGLFQYRMLSGNHFFIHHHRATILQAIQHDLFN